jgi:hypothetical protein
VDARQPFAFASRYALIDGDPRDFHKHLLGLPPGYKGRPVPTWFRKARMFISDQSGTGLGLMTRTDQLLKDVASFLPLLREDEQLMVFFNHWTTMGDFPYQGTLRYYTYTDAGYSQPVPVEKFKENIRKVKALSPKIKVGGYALFVPLAGTPPYDQHPDWMAYNKDGQIEFGGDGTGAGGVPDFSSGYRDYLLDQMKHYIVDLGFDWIHVDCGPFEAVNYRAKEVIQSYETGRFYDRLGTLFGEHEAAIVQNIAWTAGLWADGTYMECQQPDRWEKKDWRIRGVTGYLNALYRTHRPGTWVNLCYGTQGMYGVRNAYSGMRGWIRGSLTWWRDVSHSLAQDRVIDELLETRLSDCRVSPSWWKLQTDKLEAEALEKGSAVIVPLMWHGDHPSQETITLRGVNPRLGARVFSFDLRLSRPDALPVFTPVPWSSDYMELARVPETQVWVSDHAHLFLDPYRDMVRWFEIGVDTAGTVADIKNDATGADMKWNGRYEVKTGLNYNVGWMMEMRVPFSTLGRAPTDGDVWGVTFARIDMTKEFSVWTPGPWNDPSIFGELAFGGQAVSRDQQLSDARQKGDVLWYCSFDGTVEPEIHAGDKTVRTSAPPEFIAGIKGQALVTGHSRNAVYPLKDHLRVAEGSIKFWVMPMDWDGREELFHHFFRIPGREPQKGSTAKPFDLILYRFLEWPTVAAYGMAGELTTSNILQSPMNKSWAPGRWHQIVFAWDAQEACLYVDGQGKRQKYLRAAPDAVFEDSFVVGGPYFIENNTQTAIDELYIFNRKLSADEIARSYRLESATATVETSGAGRK